MTDDWPETAVPGTVPAGELPGDGGPGVDREWDEPLPLAWSVSLPPYPVDALPPMLAAYVSALATETQTPPDMAGTVVLGVLAACIGGRVDVRCPTWTEPTCLYVVPIARPGSRKSGVVAACRAPLDAAQAALVEARRGEITSQDVERTVRERYATRCAAAAAETPTPEAMAEAQQAAMAAEAVEVPAWPRLIASDATPEALVTLLATQGGRLAAISAEAGIFGALTGRYARTPNLDPVLQAHAGDAITVDRRGREPEHIARPALTIVASIQPYALRELVSRPDFGGRGLLARVLWSITPDTVGYRQVRGVPVVPDDVRYAYHHLVQTLAVDMAGRTEPITLTFGLAAAEVITTYAERVEVALRPGGDLSRSDLVRDWSSKLVGAVARIAGCLAVAAGTLDRSPRVIDASTATQAVRLGEYYRAHAIAALAPGDDRRAVAARELLRYVTEHLGASHTAAFARRDVLRRGPRSMRSAVALDATLGHLADYGWITAIEGAGRYLVHPGTRQMLASGDSGDTGDTADILAGQTDDELAPDVSPPVATSGDNPPRHGPGVATVASLGDTRGDGRAPTLTSADAPAVAAVAAVAMGTRDRDTERSAYARIQAEHQAALR